MIIDLLTTQDKDNLKFTVDTNELSVPLVYPDPLPSEAGLLYDARQGTLFRRLDHITLLSIGLLLPLNFQLYYYSDDGEPHFWNGLPRVVFYAREAISGNEEEISTFVLPFSDYELSMNLFKEFYEHVIEESFQLKALVLQAWNGDLNFSIPRVSMVNCPAALNGLTFSVPIFAKVMHNINITAIP